jgi:RNA polymerase sigma factor (sigma-70 family)
MSPPPAEQFAARVFLGPTLRAQPDRRLVDLVRDGYDAAFEEIVRRYRRPLDRFAAAIVGGRSEDITQDALSKALLALRGSEREIELRPWLYRIVRNTALNDLRDRAPATEQLTETMPGAPSAAAEVEAREELRDLMERLGALPEPQRAALVMRELEGLSHDEIAAALGVSGGAARQTIFRARAALREGLGLFLPLPVVRALAERADDATRAGGAIAAGAGASSAGGAVLGGAGGGALKAGMAAVLIAGTVGAGVAIDHHRGDRPGPEAAEAATLPRDARGDSRSGGGTAGGDEAGDRHGSDQSGDDHGGKGSGHGGGGIGGGGRSGSGDLSGTSGGSGGGGHGGSSPNSGPDSISGGRGDDGGGDSHGGSGSGSDGGGSDDPGGTSGGSGDGGSLESGSGDSSGSGSGEIESGQTDPETTTSDGGGDSSDGSESGSGSDGSGSSSDDFSSSETTNLDGSP